MFNLSLMCVYLQVLNLKNSKIGNRRIFTHPRAEYQSAMLLLEKPGPRAGQLGRPRDHSSFGWGGGFCGVKGQLIVGVVLKISLSLSLNISILAWVAPTA